MALSLLNANTFNAYTGSFQVDAAFTRLWRRFRAESVTVRVIPFLAVMAAGTVIACYGYQQFVTNLSNFLDDLLMLFIPWSAVNLADYFLVRRGDYDVASFFTPDGDLRAVRLARPARLPDRPGRGVSLRLPAGLHRAAGQAPGRRRHLLARRLDRRGRGVPVPGIPRTAAQPARPADARAG